MVALPIDLFFIALGIWLSRWLVWRSAVIFRQSAVGLAFRKE